ncbi:MAG TPA: hypothetical protein VNE86_07930 [Nitrososphaerales archaeon]|nr:hypothetical protein [Nitrososphaerales archaeon]
MTLLVGVFVLLLALSLYLPSYSVTTTQYHGSQVVLVTSGNYHVIYVHHVVNGTNTNTIDDTNYVQHSCLYNN